MLCEDGPVMPLYYGLAMHYEHDLVNSLRPFEGGQRWPFFVPQPCFQLPLIGSSLEGFWPLPSPCEQH